MNEDSSKSSIQSKISDRYKRSGNLRAKNPLNAS